MLALDPPLRLITDLLNLVVRAGRMAPVMDCLFLTSLDPEAVIAIFRVNARNEPTLALFKGHANICAHPVSERRIPFEKKKWTWFLQDRRISEAGVWRFIWDVEARIDVYTGRRFSRHHEDQTLPPPLRPSLREQLSRRSVDVVFDDPAYKMPIPNARCWRECAQQFDEPDRLASVKEGSFCFLVLDGHRPDGAN